MFSNWPEKTVDQMDDIVEMVDSAQSVLHPEILSHIFAYLPLTDRKMVRQTCLSWYNCSVHPNIIKSEKYVFRINSNVEEIAELMLRSNYSLLHLEFQGVRVKELPADSWKVCGDRVQTLEFHECYWNVETFRNVILYCTNLTSIVIKSTFVCQGTVCPIDILCSSNVLDDLIKEGLRRSKLRTFAMFNEGVPLPERVFNTVFLLFPGIEHFSTGLISFDILSDRCPALYFIDTPPVSFRLDQCFNPETRLESLTLNLPMDGNRIGTLLQKAEQGIRLKKLETMLVYESRQQDSLFDFFRSQRNLEVLKLGIAGTNADENKELFFRILDNCINLQEFIFQTEAHRMHLEPSEVQRFITCTRKLKFLSAVFDVDHGTPAPLYHDLLAKPAQLNLTSLRWDNLNVDFSDALLEHCPSLLHLYFGGVHRNATLQIIFQFLVKLRTLVLYDINSCTDYGFTGRGVGREEGYSIKRLQQLKYLKLEVARSSLTRESTLELQLPHLEFLSLNSKWLEELRSEEALDHFASHLPELRVLAVDKSDPERHHRIKRVCRRLKNLNRLICLEGYSIFTEEVFAEDIFESCPCLKYIRFVGNGVFSRNLFTGKVFLSDFRSFKFPGNVFEGDELSAKTAGLSGMICFSRRRTFMQSNH